MSTFRKKNKTYYRYVAVYFTALFLIAALVMTVVLFLSARQAKLQETRNLENSLKQGAEVLEKQYEVMESIAMQIATKVDYRLYRVEQGGVYDIDLLERFKQYANYSPLTSQYFLVYRSVQKIYTSQGNTSYFDYYAPANLQVPYELTGEVLRRITSASSPYFEFSGNSILVVFPIHFAGLTSSEECPATFCFVLTEPQIRQYLSKMTSGIPEEYGITVGSHTMLELSFSEPDFGDHEEMVVASSKGRVILTADSDISGWDLLFRSNGGLILASIFGCLALAALTAMRMANFSLRPLDRLIEKYAGQFAGDNEFQQLDSILDEMEQNYQNSQHQLKNQLLVRLLRGNYNDRILQRWSMLKVQFDHLFCCVYLIENTSGFIHRGSMVEELEKLSDENSRIYTADFEETPHLIVITNCKDSFVQEETFQKIKNIAGKYHREVYSGKNVETPKRLPISYMAALTEIRLQTAGANPQTDSAEVLAERLITTVSLENEEEIQRVGKSIYDFISYESRNGALTKHHIYDLASALIHKVEEKGITVDRAAINSLVLLSDTSIVVQDLIELLKNAMTSGLPNKVEMDETAKLIVEYVIANAYDADLNLKAMSDTFGFSSDYISSMIKRETGTAFKEYITMLRISEARRLLENTNLTINEVAEKVGYRKASNFSKKYKEITGILPSQVRSV